MDKQIKSIRKDVSKTEKKLKKLQEMDEKRDPACKLGKKAMKK